MNYISNFLFLIALVIAVWFFAKNVGQIRKNINLGRDLERTDRKKDRLNNMLRVAFGQSKMQARPVAGILHFIVYVSFLIINIEVLEIV